jgi:hypothetical protein
VAGQEASSTMQIEERQAPTAATAVMAIWWLVKCRPIPAMYGRWLWLRRGRGGLELMVVTLGLTALPARLSLRGRQA